VKSPSPTTWQDLFEEQPALPRPLLHWWLADRRNCSLTLLPLHDDPSPDELRAFEAAVPRLLQGEPVQYVCGRAPFRDFDLLVDSRVLIPRPETEELVDLALRHALPPSARVLDVGTGSGCIAIAIKRARPDCSVEGIDISPGALDVARANAAALGLDIPFRQADLLLSEPDAHWDLIIANLPYIGHHEHPRMDPWVLAHEPHLALFAEEEGTELMRKLLEQASRVLAPGGKILLESGDEQSAFFQTQAQRLGWTLRCFCDVAGKPRFWLMCFLGVDPKAIHA
jgi:release factor glutamine methyltransferase